MYVPKVFAEKKCIYFCAFLSNSNTCYYFYPPWTVSGFSLCEANFQSNILTYVGTKL